MVLKVLLLPKELGGDFCPIDLKKALGFLVGLFL
jgi:hypothetical protein